MNKKEELLKAFHEHQTAKVNEERLALKALMDYVKLAQEGVGFVRFTEETGFPTFHDESIDSYPSIYGVKVAKKKHFKDSEEEVLMLYTDDSPYDEMETNEDGWFYFFNYGTMDYDELLTSVMMTES